MAEEYKKNRTTAKSQFTRYVNRLQKALDLEDCDSWTLEARYTDLKERWERVQDAHDTYVGEVPDEDAEGMAPWLDELLDIFDELELKVGKKMNEVKKRDKPNDQGETRVVSGQDPGQPRKVSISVDQAAIPLQEMKSAINEWRGAIQDVGT